MRVEPELQKKAIHEILMRILKRWRHTQAAKQGVPDEGTLMSAIAEEKLSELRGIGERKMDVKETIILSPHASNMNSGTLHQKLDEPEQPSMVNKTKDWLRKASSLSGKKEVQETVILSPSSPRAGSTALPSRKGSMEQTLIISNGVDLIGKRAYPPKVSDIYETVILNPKDWKMEASSLKEKGSLLDTALVRCPEESTDRKSVGETSIQGTKKTGRSESKTFEGVRKPPKATGGGLLDQTIIVGSGNEKEGE